MRHKAQLIAISALLCLSACSAEVGGAFHNENGADAALRTAGRSPAVQSYKIPGHAGALAINGQQLISDGGNGVWVLSQITEAKFPVLHLFITHITADGVVTPNALRGITTVWSIALGPDRRVYFPIEDRAEIGAIDDDGRIRVYALPKGYSTPTDVAPGSDGVWFSEGYADNPREGVAKIYPNGHIVEFPLGVTPRLEGPGAAYLQDDGEGGVWFVATRHLSYCVPIPCPPWIGHFGRGGALQKYSFTHGSTGRVDEVAIASGAYWFGANFFRPGVAFTLPGKMSKQYVVPSQGDGFPIGAIGGTMWIQTTLPTFALFSATVDRRPSRVHVNIPLAGSDDGSVTAIAANGYLWFVEGDTGFAYRYDPKSRSLEHEYFAATNESTSPEPLVINNRLWFIGSGRVWSVNF